MKKSAIILLVVFVVALVVSSCNRELCPAYTKAENDQTEQVG
jgi:hypothetical protein